MKLVIEFLIFKLRNETTDAALLEKLLLNFLHGSLTNSGYTGTVKLCYQVARRLLKLRKEISNGNKTL